MPTVRDILARKGSAIASVTPATTVLEAASLMNGKGIGSVLVLNGTALAGIFTERDVLRRVVAVRLDPSVTRIADVMTADPVICTPDTPLEQCAAIFSSRRIRHLPVLGPDGLAGVITTGDLLAFQLDDQAATIQQLNNYVYDMR
ncbi:MAG: CBS domain-containing protein [Gemmatimonadales bacterium]